MAELTINQIIKLILGFLVFVAVVIGIYFFFRYNVIDFFSGIGEDESGLPASEEQETETPPLEESSITCEDCKKGFFDVCSEKECLRISGELSGFNKRCQYVPRIINFRQRKAAECITINT